MRIALATAIAAYARDDDLAPLLRAFREAGVPAEALAWDDPTVEWSRFDAVLLRSTWDYTQHLQRFLSWCERIDQCSLLLNPLPTIRWNIDKHYLGELAGKGAPVIETHYFEPAQGTIDAEALTLLGNASEFVIKPCVGAGSRDAQRFQRQQMDAALAHANRLLARAESIMLQPYLGKVDEVGETALIYLGGRYSHAIRKGPLLKLSTSASDDLFLAEDIQPRIASPAEHAVADAVIKALPELPLYARVDLLPSTEGPRLLELELVEPSLFFEHSEDAAERLVKLVYEAVQAAEAMPVRQSS
ncbi:ATP-grasp domain-containing protein [Pseudomarimonas arenosa]|uniref:ATP-grasp domain-containing protein n=1 Tax=Pseudomarimonas arenosa TaxID=2774145 RepID=A0AAW3ZKJ0_9GAMM|nr:hypothetical protein [Pseudomarimonas arenosa]MBD8525430.1 hypothetical protein [Pseudomarimonas arenosa]